MLYALSGVDPISMIIAISLMLLVATIAGYIPARRAARVVEADVFAGAQAGIRSLVVGTPTRYERLEAGFEGPQPHFHRRHVDSFFVVEGEPELRACDQTLRAEPGTFVSAPPGLVHSFSNPGPGRARVINVHAPSCGFHEYLHVLEREEDLDDQAHARFDVYTSRP